MARETNVIGAIAGKELLDHLLSLKFHVSMIAMVALLGLSAYVMYGDYQLRMANYSVMRDRAHTRAGESGVMAVVAPRPLSVFAKGLDELMTRGYEITSYLGVQAHDRQRPSDSLFSLFAAPDLLYIVKAVLSLIAMLFAYDAVSGERESGTLKLMLSSSVSRGQVIAAKIFGGLAAMLVPFLAAALGMTAVLSVSSAMRLSGEDYARLAAMLGAAVLYILFFFSLGTLVSSVARTSATSLMVLLFVWAMLVFAAPNAANLIAEQMQPLPSAETVQALTTQEFAKNRFIQIQSQGRDQAGHIEAFNRAYDQIVENYRAKLDALIDTSKSLSRVSPAASLSYILTDLAGTGLEDQRRLSRELVSFKDRNFMQLGTQSGTGAPSFEFRPAGLADSLSRTLPDFAVLALWTATLFAAAVTAFARADVR